MPLPSPYQDDLRRYVLEARANAWVWEHRVEVSRALLVASSAGRAPPREGRGAVPLAVRRVLEEEMEIVREEREAAGAAAAGGVACGSATRASVSSEDWEEEEEEEEEEEARGEEHSDSDSEYEDSTEEIEPVRFPPSRDGATTRLEIYRDEDEDEDEDEDDDDDDWAYGAEIEEEWSKLATSLASAQGKSAQVEEPDHSTAACTSTSTCTSISTAASTSNTEDAVAMGCVASPRPPLAALIAPTLPPEDVPQRGSSLPRCARARASLHVGQGGLEKAEDAVTPRTDLAGIAEQDEDEVAHAPADADADEDGPFDLDVSFDTTMDQSQVPGCDEDTDEDEEQRPAAAGDVQSMLTFSESEGELNAEDADLESEAASLAGTKRPSRPSSAFSDSDSEEEDGGEDEDEEEQAESDDDDDDDASTLNISESFFSCASHASPSSSSHGHSTTPSAGSTAAGRPLSATALAIAKGGNDFYAVLHACIHGPDEARDLARELYWAERIARTLARPTMQPYEYDMRERLDSLRARAVGGADVPVRCSSPEQAEALLPETQPQAQMRRKWSFRRRSTRHAARSQSYDDGQGGKEQPTTPAVKMLLARRRTWREGSPTPSEETEAASAEQPSSSRWRLGRSKSLLRGRTWSVGFKSKD